MSKKTTKKPKLTKDELLDGWLRAKAELENIKKTQIAERLNDRQRTVADTLLPLLALADNFRAMTEQVPSNLKEDAWAQGVVHIASQLDSILNDFNVNQMSALNTAFDPTMHEAIDQAAEVKAKSGQIVEVLQAGYLIGDKVLRPAKVKVAK